MSDLQVYLNGRLVPASEARISVFDSGLLHGASAFSTMLAHKGKVFRLDRHLRRLRTTCDLLGLRTGATDEALASAAGEVLRANSLSEARMRITLSPGSVKDEDAGPTVLITAEPVQEYPKAWYEKGISVVVSSYRQARGDPTYGHKTGNYLTRMLARQEAARKGAEEALWYTADNLLSEACFCNVFLVLEGTVRTPPLDTPVLGGIVREAVIELCAATGIACDDQLPLTVREMLAAGEMFLTSSTAGIRPVARVERHPVGQEKPGPVTLRLMEAYAALLERECS
jgi:branched-chain amino acid aminotransferase